MLSSTGFRSSIIHTFVRVSITLIIQGFAWFRYWAHALIACALEAFKSIGWECLVVTQIFITNTVPIGIWGDTLCRSASSMRESILVNASHARIWIRTTHFWRQIVGTSTVWLLRAIAFRAFQLKIIPEIAVAVRAKFTAFFRIQTLFPLIVTQMLDASSWVSFIDNFQIATRWMHISLQRTQHCPFSGWIFATFWIGIRTFTLNARIFESSIITQAYIIAVAAVLFI